MKDLDRHLTRLAIALSVLCIGLIAGRSIQHKVDTQCTDPQVMLNHISFVGNEPSFDVHRCEEGIRIVNVRMGQ